MELNRDTLGYLGLDFQHRLIQQIVLDRNFGETIIDIIKANYFETPTLRLACSKIIDNYERFNTIPDINNLESIILETINNPIDKQSTLEEFQKIRDAELNNGYRIQETAMKFCKQQELKKVIKGIQKIVDNGNIEEYDKCEDMIKQVLEIGSTKDDGLDVFMDIESVLADDFRNPIATGIDGLDAYMDGGLSKGELAVIIAPFGVGKAQPMFSKILTPNGWTTMGDIKVGDYVISRDGKPTKVNGVFPQGKRPIYSVNFNDGTKTLCDAEHLWAVNTINQRNKKTKKNGKTVYLESDNTFKTMKTIDMINSVKVWGNRRLNYKIPVVLPVEFNSKNLIIDPYLLGVIVGGRCITNNNDTHFVTKDSDIISEVNKVYPNISIKEEEREVEKEINGELVLVKRSLTKVSLLDIKKSLIKLDLYDINNNTKFIPKDYLYSSVSDRIALLQGLVDTYGCINAHRVEISTVSKELSINIRELVLSLGGRASISEKFGSCDDIICKPYYLVNFSFPDNSIIPTRLERKLVKFKPRTKYSNNKFIESIEYFGEEDSQCIMVENDEHLYVTDDYIVTHNTTLITKMANHAKNIGKNVIQIFFEDNPKVIQRKHLTCWMNGDLTLNELNNFKEIVLTRAKEMQERPGIIKLKKFPSDGTTIPQIKQYIKKQISKGFLPDIIFIDYIDCVQPSKQFKESWDGEGNVMRQFESMLSELNLAGWTAVQGNRSSIKSEIVEADQIGGSIKKGQIGHFIMSIAKSLEQKENGTANIAILKSRFGKDGIVFENVQFNNGTIQISINESDKQGKTLYQTEEIKSVRGQLRINELYENQERLRAMSNDI
jgi:hypothetical protein